MEQLLNTHIQPAPSYCSSTLTQKTNNKTSNEIEMAPAKINKRKILQQKQTNLINK